MFTLRIDVLGPLEVHRNGELVRLGGPKERTVLAALVLSINHAVSTDNLVTAVWGDGVPESSHDTLQSIVSRLRSQLGSHVIELIDHSYRLKADPTTVDAIRFERRLERAAGQLADDPAAAAALARDALSMWRGSPFGDLGLSPFLEAEARRLTELRLRALEVCLEGDVASWHLAPAIARLQAEVTDHPYRERLWYLLALALARDGRRVEALRACHDLRTLLAAIGLEPSAEILDLEDKVYREDPLVRARLTTIGARD